MRQIAYVISVLAALPAVATAQASAPAAGSDINASSQIRVAPVAAMTLDQAIADALQHNELVAESQEAARKSRDKVLEVGANALPQIKVTGNAIWEKETSVTLPGAGGQAMSVTISPAKAQTAAATLTQLVDIFGAVGKARNIADISRRVQELNVVRSRSEVIYQTRSAYYNVLRAQGGVDVAQAAVTDAQEQLRLAQAFVKEGASAQFDVTRATVLLADRQQTLISTQNSLALASAAFNNVLGRDVNTLVNLAPVETKPDRNVDIPGQTEKALQSRPEIVQAELGVRAQRVVVSLQRIGNYPQVALSANYDYSFQTSGFSTNKGTYTYGVGVSWPLWDSGSTAAKVREAQSDVRSATLQQQQLRRGVALEVLQAGLNVQQTADRYDVAEQALAQAQEALRLARVRYQNGVSTQLEVVDAETQLTQAEFNRNNARYDHFVAKAAFDRSLMGGLGSSSSASSSQETTTTVSGGVSSTSSSSAS